MSEPSRVRSIFFAAIDKKTAAERAEYLDHACGDDTVLRQWMGRHLEADLLEENSLARPAVVGAELDPHDTTDVLSGTDPAGETGAGKETEPEAAGMIGPTSTETLLRSGALVSETAPGTAPLSGQTGPDGALGTTAGPTFTRWE
jgi:hypothetical protein